MGWQVVYVPFLFAGGTIINQNGLFVYSGTPGPGNLIFSIANASGVDNFSNPYLAGADSQLNLGGKTQHGELFGGALQLGTNLANSLSLIESSTDGQLLFQSGASTAADNVASMLMESSLESGINVPAIKLADLLQLQTTTSTPPSQLGYAGLFGHPDGDPHFVDAGDSSEYATAARFLFTTVPVTINALNPGNNIGQLTFNVAVGASTSRPYWVRGKLRAVAAASGTTQPINILFTGTATLSGMAIEINAYNESSNVTSNYGFISALSTPASSPLGAVTNGQVICIEFEGFIQVSANGTFSPNLCVVTSASDETFSAQSGRCWMAVSPVDLHGT